mmetsp:Transcript_50780/g.99273  ORF Transcript_50780/g.99273 Transcript_50780/m.99273 type:complete len:166 (+) Transcript_50780:70-567(+)
MATCHFSKLLKKKKRCFFSLQNLVTYSIFFGHDDEEQIIRCRKSLVKIVSNSRDLKGFVAERNENCKARTLYSRTSSDRTALEAERKCEKQPLPPRRERQKYRAGIAGRTDRCRGRASVVVSWDVVRRACPCPVPVSPAAAAAEEEAAQGGRHPRRERDVCGGRW